jgi:hypothetical protein
MLTKYDNAHASMISYAEGDDE